MRTSVRFYGQLTDLADAAELAVPMGTKRSVKDLIEAQGVPHPEIGLVVVDGEPVGLDHVVAGGERVAVYPPFRSIEVPADLEPAPRPTSPRFIADVHLGTLARRLRLLGLDTWYDTHATDRELARRAVREQRVLLTRDRGLLMRRVITHGYCPRSDDPDRQLDEVVERYDLEDRLAPGTRCVACNGRLVAATADEVAAEVPPRTRRAFDTYRRCDTCGQVFWPGAHRPALQRIVRQAGTTRGAPRPPDERPAGSGTSPAVPLASWVTDQEEAAVGLNIQDLTISSDDFAPGGRLDAKHANDGDNLAPTLHISGVPSDAVELAIICHDPDAPLPRGFAHWTLYGVPTDATTIGPDADERFRPGPNDFGATGYGGPQPPPGHGVHHYYFWVYALDTAVDGTPSRPEFLERYGSHVIEQNRVVGTYEN